MKSAAGSAKNATAAAISSGLPRRPIGVCCASSGSSSGGSSFSISVRMTPGATQFTRMWAGGQLRRQRPGQADDGRLGGGVGHLAAGAPLAPDGGDVHNAAPHARGAWRAAPPGWCRRLRPHSRRKTRASAHPSGPETGTGPRCPRYLPAGRRARRCPPPCRTISSTSSRRDTSAGRSWPGSPPPVSARRQLLRLVPAHPVADGHGPARCASSAATARPIPRDAPVTNAIFSIIFRPPK